MELRQSKQSKQRLSTKDTKIQRDVVSSYLWCFSGTVYNISKWLGVMKFFLLVCLLVLSGCASTPPKNTDNICSTFHEKEEWYANALQTYRRWGVPIAVQMAIMHQESHFVADAKPPMDWLLGIIPLGRVSSAYGYAQALDGTWDNYLDSVGNWGADRDEFADATDFIGWYCHVSNTKLGIPKSDAKNLYLAYHEGFGGYKRKTYLQKAWLQRVANKVASRAKIFQSQLSECAVRNN